MDCSLPHSSVHGIFQEYCSGLPFPTLRDLPYPGIEPSSLASPALAGGFFTTAPPGKPGSSLVGNCQLLDETQGSSGLLFHDQTVFSSERH